MMINTSSRLSSGGEVFMNAANKPVVRFAGLSAVRRPVTALALPISKPPAISSANLPQTYHMIQIGDEVFKVATATSVPRSTEEHTDINKQPPTEIVFDRKFYGDADSSAAVMLVTKSEKDACCSNDDTSLSSDDASDLSLQLDDTSCSQTTPSTTSTTGLTTIVQGPDGQFFVPVHSLGSNLNNNIVLEGCDFSTASTHIEEASRKRELRLLKNREAAKECRRKKKDYVRCLENRVALLENQNKTLINELKSLKELYCQKEVHS